jgi:hypothetical protein
MPFLSTRIFKNYNRATNTNTTWTTRGATTTTTISESTTYYKISNWISKSRSWRCPSSTWRTRGARIIKSSASTASTVYRSNICNSSISSSISGT